MAALAATMSVGASAQYAEKLTQASYSSISPNGTWLAENFEGSVSVYNRATQQRDEFISDMGSFSLGLGNCVSNNGVVVGAADEGAPVLFVDGDTISLPVGDIELFYGSCANGITPDGSVIVGSLACGNYLSEDPDASLFLVPVLWKQNADGSYADFEVLPYPAKDFQGKSPQYITALAVSEDGKTIVGQLTDWSGTVVVPLVYKQAEDGTWSYSLISEDLLYDKELVAQLPECPSFTANYPNAEDYMTEEEKAAYAAAMEAYNEALDAYYNGLIEEWPDMPDANDFIGAEGLAAYEEAVAAYYAAHEAYEEAYLQYEEAYDAAVFGTSFAFNSVKISSNGRYVGTELSEPDPNSAGGWGPTPVILTPGIIDLQADAPAFEALNGTDMLVSCVSDEGLVMAATPATEYSRCTVVYADKNAEPQPIVDYVKAKNEELGNWIDENLRFDVTEVSYDDEWNEVVTLHEDSLITGTLYATPDGAVLCSFLYDMWSEEEAGPLSYVVDFFGVPSGIEQIGAAGRQPGLKVVDGRLCVDGDVRKVSIIDASGRTLRTMNGSGAALQFGATGAYIVRMECSDGSVVSRKVLVK